MEIDEASAQTALAQSQPEEQANVQHSHTSGQTSTNENLKAATVHSMEYHRNVLKEKNESGEQGKGHYISPSDGIMSPATQKLSNIKGKRFKNAGKGQNLFAKALGKKAVESRMSAANAEPSAPTEQAETPRD